VGEVDEPAFLLVESNLEGCQRLPEAFVYGLEEPVMRRIGIPQEHASLREPGLCEGGRGPTAGALLRPLQSPLHRREIQMTAER
jgi:hypothetical protein